MSSLWQYLYVYWERSCELGKRVYVIEDMVQGVSGETAVGLQLTCVTLRYVASGVSNRRDEDEWRRTGTD